MKSFGLTDNGKVRKDNQDSFVIERCPSKGCFVIALCDGMGGAKAGGLASHLSNKSFVDFVYGKLTSRVKRVTDYKQLLIDACAEANGVSYEYSHFDKAYNGMGTTLVGGVIKDNGTAYIINVGDSRAYHISRREKDIRQITKDHSLVEDLVTAGAITREEANVHPQRNIITRAIGTDCSVEADYFKLNMRSGDVLLFCSDGLTNTLSDFDLLDSSLEHGEPESICRELMKMALDKGARDNVTVVAVVR